MAETAPRPKLEACLEGLAQLTRQLREASAAYQQMKSLLQQVREDPAKVDLSQFNVVMTIPGTTFQVPVSIQGSQEQIAQAVEDGAAALGEQIVSLWAEAHAITGEANTHCQAAAAAAEEQQAPQQPQQPVQPVVAGQQQP